MSERRLTPVQEQYLKVIWNLGEDGVAQDADAKGGDTSKGVVASGECAPASAPITNSLLAERLGQSTSTVSEMLKRLDSDGYIIHQPYGNIRLTPAGRAVAVRIVRRHRLLETFLAETLGYTWDEVHQEADILEHVVSDTMIERIAARLDDPAYDPHGDPIPTGAGRLRAPGGRLLLTALPVQTWARVVRVADTDSDFLRYLTGQGVTIGSRLTRLPRAPFTSDVVVRIGADSADDASQSPPHDVTIAADRARTVHVCLIQPESEF